MANPTPVARVPTTIQVATGAPNDPLAMVMYLTQLQTSLNTWTAKVATAVNALLDRTGL